MSKRSLLTPDGRVVMISGASQGIGEAIAERLLIVGYRLSLGVREVEATRAKFAAAGTSEDAVIVEHFEARDAATAEAWVNRTLAHFGALHALVNNAGIWRQVNFEEGDEAALDDLWAVNVKSPFRLTRLALPHLRKCGIGRVVNIASTDGIRFRDATCSVGYTMSKHALVAMSQATRHFGYEDGVRVTALCPGGVRTDLIAGVPGVTPLCERLEPDTVAHTVAYLLSLPNNATVAWMPLNSRLESTI